jgi:hypothetical protein
VAATELPERGEAVGADGAGGELEDLHDDGGFEDDRLGEEEGWKVATKRRTHWGKGRALQRSAAHGSKAAHKK